MYGKIIKILKHRDISLKPDIAVGKISLGKYTCCINEVFDTKHDVQLLNVLENVEYNRIPIIIFKGNRVSVSPLKITKTT
tara:strand:+ start:392 stop:631 length:240 start_codon:yes stop_codon:yes gene_type:complete